LLFIVARTTGNGTSDFTLGSHGSAVSAFTNASPDSDRRWLGQQVKWKRAIQNQATRKDPDEPASHASSQISLPG
jgi:hypothetical protein